MVGYKENEYKERKKGSFYGLSWRTTWEILGEESARDKTFIVADGSGSRRAAEVPHGLQSEIEPLWRD